MTNSTTDTTTEQIKKEDKKAIGPFLLLMIVSTLIGGLAGYGMTHWQRSFQEINLVDTFHQAQLNLAEYASVATFIICVLLSIGGFIFYAYCKSFYKKHNIEDEVNLEKLDSLLSINLFVVSLTCCISWALFGTGFYCISMRELNGISILLCLVGFIISLIFTLILQQKIINFAKEIYPEKRGSVYDLHFQKKWMNSCDEAELYTTYKASFKAYRATNLCCMVMLVILGLLGMEFPIGILPLICICIIWAVQIISYTLASMKHN